MSRAHTSPSAAAAPWAERAELFAAGALAFASTSPGLLLLGVSEDPNAPENPIFRLVWLPVFAGALALSAWRAPRLLRAWLPILLVALLVAWAQATKSWSLAPDVTGRRVLALALTTVLGIYLGGALSGRRFTEMLAAVFAALAAGSALIAVLDPKIGVMRLDGGVDWRGLWPHKNALAFNMAIGALACACAATAAPERRGRWFAGVALCLLLLLMSRGKSSLLAALLVLAGWGLLAALRRGPLVAVVTVWATGVAAFALGLVAWLAPAAALKAIGKDPTLTGRTDIWAAVLRQWARSPHLGYGFAAFWEKGSVPALVVQREAHWTVPSAHNGWLDLLVQVGDVGVGLFAAVLVLGLVAAALRTHRLGDGGFGLLFLVLFAFLSLSESVIEAPNSVAWVLFVAVLVRVLGPRPPDPAAGPPRPGREPAAASPHERPIWRDPPVPAGAEGALNHASSSSA